MCAIFKINGAGGDFLNNIATNPFLFYPDI